jgi:hypothetical protein
MRSVDIPQGFSKACSVARKALLTSGTRRSEVWSTALLSYGSRMRCGGSFPVFVRDTPEYHPAKHVLMLLFDIRLVYHIYHIGDLEGR